MSSRKPDAKYQPIYYTEMPTYFKSKKWIIRSFHWHQCTPSQILEYNLQNLCYTEHNPPCKHHQNYKATHVINLSKRITQRMRWIGGNHESGVSIIGKFNSKRSSTTCLPYSPFPTKHVILPLSPRNHLIKPRCSFCSTSN